jgi:DNA-binding GntR family transcriptional regulator
VAAREFLKNILQTYNIISFSYQVISSEGLVRPPNETIHEHLAVINAISGRDADGAENLMRLHFRKTIATLKKEIENQQAGARMSA